MSKHYSVHLSLIQDSERETFENHTATVLLRSSAPRRRLNKAVKKLIPLGRHACKHTQIQTREPGGERKCCLMFMVLPLVLLSFSFSVLLLTPPTPQPPTLLMLSG